jgi:hypothetical protein
VSQPAAARPQERAAEGVREVQQLLLEVQQLREQLRQQKEASQQADRYGEHNLTKRGYAWSVTLCLMTAAAFTVSSAVAHSAACYNQHCLSAPVRAYWLC